MVSIKYTKMTVPTWKTCTEGRKRAFHKKYAKVAFYVTTKLESNYDLSHNLWVGLCKLKNEILKDAKNAQKCDF